MIADAPNSVSEKPKPKQLELADIMRQFGPSFLATHKMPLRHRKVMQQIINCRTAVLGGHQHWCARCDYSRHVYHSCRNRHCPKCQTSAKERWREARQTELLPVPYLLLNLLFETVSATLSEFGKRTFGGQIGFPLVLHTWDQQMRPHYHLHCLIPAGALIREGESSRWIAGGKQFLFPVRGLSMMFRAKFLAGFRKLLAEESLDLTDAVDSAVKRPNETEGRQAVADTIPKSQSCSAA